jgi:sulfatase modifying factor 1
MLISLVLMLGVAARAAEPKYHWKLDETGGATVYDDNGNLNITNYGAAVGAPGPAAGDMAYTFSDNTDKVGTGSNTIIPASGPWRIEITFNTTFAHPAGDPTDQGHLFGNNDGGDLSRGALHIQDGTLRYWQKNGPSITDTVNVADGQWHTVVFERTGSTFTLYRDGNVAGSAVYSGNMGQNTEWVIGRASGVSPNPYDFQGAISDIKLWDDGSFITTPEDPEGTITNSIGMKLVPITAGTFTMGSTNGDPDEEPIHQVTISNSFYMGLTEVTNAQYEQFDPSHSTYRSRQYYNNGYSLQLSSDDDDAVIYVSWEDANAFCGWLSNLEGQTYRLPTEAEWEYACRADTTTNYSTGDSMSSASAYYKSQSEKEWPGTVDLSAQSTAQNAWGLWEMHGNVEEWCYDWYGPYGSGSQIDPVGRANGQFKVARGGAHNTDEYYLRSANRQSSLPGDRQWVTGFRVVKAEMATTAGLPDPPAKEWATDVSQTVYNWPREGQVQDSYFQGPSIWVRDEFIDDESIPMWWHNHQPAVTFCDNGDLLGAWYSCKATENKDDSSNNSERDRGLTVLASRLRSGETAWDKPAEFFKAQDRNMHGSALLNDGNGKLYMFNGMSTDFGWQNLALCTSTSTDNGVTWQPRIINPKHQRHNQIIAGAIVTSEGYIMVAGDANPGSATHYSTDDGETFLSPADGDSTPIFSNGGTGAWIAGIHTGFVQCSDGSLMAFGRGDNIDGRMPKSVSSNMGQSWTYSATPFEGLGTGQRLVLLRLQYCNGRRGSVPVDRSPILVVSFETVQTMLNGQRQLETCSGMFAAVSYDDGATWSAKKLISDLTGSTTERWEAGGNTGSFTLSRTNAEPKGYLSATQTPDGFIHICSSRLYYKFNLKWVDDGYAPRPALAGDFSGNCDVGAEDLDMLSEDWLKQGTTELKGTEPDDGGLILHYDFDGASGGNISSIADRSASGINLTAFSEAASGALKYGVTNPWTNSGTSADFQNSSTDPGSALYALDNTVIDLMLGEFTVEAFIKPGSIRQSVIIRKYGGGLWYLDLQDSGQAGFAINSDNNAIFTGAGAISADNWYHIAGVFDETADKPMKIYLDGVLAGTGNYNQRPLNSDRALGVGCIVRANNTSDTGQFYDGMIDELKVYDYALSQDEIIYEAYDGPAVIYTPLDSAADAVDDDIINLKDFNVLAGNWLKQCEKN